MAVSEKELTLKAAAAEAPAEAQAAAPSRVTSVTAQSLGAEPRLEVPAGAEEFRQAAERALMAKVEAYVSEMDARHRAGEDKQALGEPTVGTYVALDVLAYSPIQQITFPPYEPSRIIAGGGRRHLVAGVHQPGRRRRPGLRHPRDRAARRAHPPGPPGAGEPVRPQQRAPTRPSS